MPEEEATVVHTQPVDATRCSFGPTVSATYFKACDKPADQRFGLAKGETRVRRTA